VTIWNGFCMHKWSGMWGNPAKSRFERVLLEVKLTRGVKAVELGIKKKTMRFTSISGG
jgi:hypothetical protein